MKKLSISIILIVACGNPPSKPQVAVDFDATGEQVEAIFADQVVDGRYCFYKTTLAKDSLSACDWEELAQVEDEVEQAEKRLRFRGDTEENQQALVVAEANLAKFKDKYLVTKKILAEGSTPLTSHSIDREELESLLALGSKSLNIAGNLALPPLSLPTFAACILGILFSKTLVCIPSAALFVASAFYGIRASGEGTYYTNRIISPYVFAVRPNILPRLDKAFQWFESKNSVPCPQFVATPEQKE